MGVKNRGLFRTPNDEFQPTTHVTLGLHAVDSAKITRQRTLAVVSMGKVLIFSGTQSTVARVRLEPVSLLWLSLLGSTSLTVLRGSFLFTQSTVEMVRFQGLPSHSSHCSGGLFPLLRGQPTFANYPLPNCPSTSARTTWMKSA